MDNSGTNNNNSGPRGSALIAVLIFTGILFILVASILAWAGTERRLNFRETLRLEARNAAEGIADYAMFQINKTLAASSVSQASCNNFTLSSALAPVLPSASFFQGTHISTVTSSTSSAAMEVIAGYAASVVTSGSTKYFIDPNDEYNLQDPGKNRWVWRYDIPIYAKASAIPGGNGKPVTAYVRETVSVRSASLFTHAIFYNMDLEIFPGPTMTISGPVHANGNIFFSSQGSSLKFTSVVSASGEVYHAWKTLVNGGKGTGNEGLDTTSPIYFNAGTSASPSYVSLLDTSSVWRDSTMGQTAAITNSASWSGATDAAYTLSLAAAATTATTAGLFKTFTSGSLASNLQTYVNGGVYETLLTQISTYSEGVTTATADSAVNTAHTVIEPPLSPSSPNYDASVESVKVSTQAGVYINVFPSSSTRSSTTVTSTFSSGSASVVVTTVSTAITSTYTVLVNGSTVSTTFAKFYPYLETQVTTTTTSGGVTSSTAVTNVVSGMYDHREAKGLDIIQLDMASLSTAIAQWATSSPAVALSIPSTSVSGGVMPSSAWTGVVYVDIAGMPTTNLNGTTTYPSTTYSSTALRVVNGDTTALATASLSFPTWGTQDEGLTIATNGPLYIKGNFNASSTNSSSTTASANEKPVALMADAITVLSNEWVDSISKSTAKPNIGTDVEISAAFLTGIVPTDKNNVAGSSGGAHNFPRLLESWGHTLHIRGSMVSMFESRVSTGKWNTNWYGPPTRDWGFNSLFQNGRFPPRTPRLVFFRRINFAILSKAQYDAAHLAILGY